MATIKGIWVFNDGVADDLDTITPNTFSFNFTSNGNSYTSFVTQYGGEFGMAQIYYDSTLAYGGDMDTSWQNEAYKTINITSEPMDEGFITWLTANATQQTTEEEEPTTNIVTVEYNGSIVATIPSGNKATIPIANKKMKTDIIITVPEAEGGADSAIPIEVSTEAEMTALLTSGEVGGVYKYTGTAGTYENGALYVLEVELITFTIAGTEYQAESGMTWAEWVEREYNTASFKVSSSYIVSSGGAQVVDSSYNTVLTSYEIISGEAYQLSQGGGA